MRCCAYPVRDGADNRRAERGRILLLADENDRVKIRHEKLNIEIKDLLTTKPFEYLRDVTISLPRSPI